MGTKIIGSGVFLESYATERRRMARRLGTHRRDLLFRLARRGGAMEVGDGRALAGLDELVADKLVIRVEQSGPPASTEPHRRGLEAPQVHAIRLRS